MLAFKKNIMRWMCTPLIAKAISRWYRGRIPFRQFVIDTTGEHVPRSAVPRLFWNLYERAEVDLVAAHLRPELHVVELGSCLGVVATLIANKQEDGLRLISVEANPDLRDVIVDNIKRNVPGKDFDVVTGAIDYSGASTVRFSVSHDAVGSHVLLQAENDEEADHEVPAIQLNQLLTEHQITGPYALVCDIEAAEAGIIYSDAQALQHCQQFIVELHPGFYGPWDTNLDSIMTELVSLGFTLRANRGQVYFYERVEAD